MQFTKTLTAAEQEMCKNVRGVFDTLSEKLKSQNNNTVLIILQTDEKHGQICRGMDG